MDELSTDSFDDMTAAISGGDSVRVQHLHNGGFPVNDRGGDLNTTPLVYALIERQTDIARFLLQHGADADATTERGVTALAEAIMQNAFEVVALLLEHGADPFQPRELFGKPWDAFTEAVEGGRTESLRELLKVRPLTNRSDLLNSLVLTAAKEAGDDSVDVLGVLLDAGADVDTLDDFGRSALTWLRARGMTGAAEFLEFHHADPSIDGTPESSAAMLAVISGAERIEAHRILNIRAQSALLAEGKKPELVGRFGDKPVSAVNNQLGASFSQLVHRVVADPKCYMGYPHKCGFDPGLALRFVRAGEAVDIWVCFQCIEFHAIRRPISDETKVIEESRALFLPTFANVIEMALAAFPNDAAYKHLLENYRSG